jgi:predicted LPLAT superfamily acyltransferase
MSIGWLRQPERGSRILVRFMIWMALSVGRSAARAVLFPICAYYLLFSREARSAIQPYLARILGRRVGSRDIFRQYHCFACTILDRVYFLAGHHTQFQITLQGVQSLKDRLVKGQGCLLLGCHMGSFEVVRAIGIAEHIEIKTLMYEQNALMMRDIFSALNPTIAETVIPSGFPDTMLRVKECLDRGGLVGIMADRLVRQEKAVVCKFLGKTAAFPRVPIWLASVLKVPTILFFGLYRGSNRYEVHFEFFAEEITIDSERRDQQLQEWTQRYVDRLEHHCRLAPDNWFNFYDFWGEQG